MVIKFSVTRLVARTHTHTHSAYTCTAWLCRVLGRESLRLCLSEADSKVSNDSHLQRPVTSSHLSFSLPSLYSVHLSLSGSLALCFYLFWPLYILLFFPSTLLLLSLFLHLNSSSYFRSPFSVPVCIPPALRKWGFLCFPFSVQCSLSQKCVFRDVYVCMCACRRVRAIRPQSQWKHLFPSASRDRLCISLLFLVFFSLHHTFCPPHSRSV